MKLILDNEANTIGQYLGARKNDVQLHQRYATAVEVLNITLSHQEQRVLARVIRYSFLLSVIDGGLGLLRHDHPLRKRILLMSALMETDTKYVHLFLTDRNLPMAAAQFLYRGSIGMVKGLFGAALISICRWK